MADGVYPPDLSWGLVIATKDRPDALQVCVRLALEQTRPPIEVVVVDASENWQAHAQLIRDLLVDHQQVQLIYEQGVVPSLTMQRNQAVTRATADIVFMIDDDAFMYPDCAAEVMKIYDADKDSFVAGVQTAVADELPASAGGTETQTRKQFTDVSPILHQGGLKRWILRHIFLMGKDFAFYPYDDSFPEYELPDTLIGLPIRQSRLFDGWRMTFRRAVVSREPFEPLLRYYCPAEDLDGSYRISRHGALLRCTSAFSHHFVSSENRLKRMQVMHLVLLNEAVFFRKNITDQNHARRVYRIRMMRRFLAETLKDIISRERAALRIRGVLRAWRDSRKVFAMSLDELEARYPGMQERIVKGRDQ